MRRALLGAAFLLAAGCACPPEGPPTIPPRSADDAALALFDLASRDGDLPKETLFQVVDADAAGGDGAALGDAIAALRSAGTPRVVTSEALPGQDRTVVTLEAGSPEGAVGRYSVQARPLADGTWRVVWFDGPGVEWPNLPVPKDSGLTTSPVE